MEITKLPDQGILIKTKLATLAIDCFTQAEKLSPGAEKADFALSSRPFLKLEKLAAENRVFSWPGEYEVKGVAVNAQVLGEIKPGEPQSLLFVVHSEPFSFCYLPELKKELHSDLIEKIGDIDLLIFTVSGDEKILVSTLEEIEPKAILPLSSPENPLAVDLLIQKLGLEKSPDSAKIVFKTKSDFNTEKMAVYSLI